MNDCVKKRRDPAWLREQREVKGRSLKDIAEECGVTKQAIHDFCRRHDIRYVRPKAAAAVDIAWLRRETERRRTQAELAAEAGVSIALIRHLQHIHGIKKPRLTKEEKQAARNAHYRNRYTTDEEYRQRLLAAACAWHQAHPEEAREHRRRYREKRRKENHAHHQ
jgi:transcriptional regulator with XRE-family HTH domain